LGKTENLVRKTTVRFPATAIGGGLKPLDGRIVPGIRLNWWGKPKKIV
jgi:hypothetical protein